MKPVYHYSIIIPVFNNQSSLVELLERIHLVFQKNKYDFEIICINDASTDESWKVLKTIKSGAAYPLKLIQFSNNYGQHKALLCGMGFARGQSAILIDADLQVPPEEINKLIQKKKETQADVVYGVFEHKHHHPIRNKFSQVFGWILKKYGAYQARGSSFKIIDQSIVAKIINTGFEYIFIDELLSWYTADFEYVSVMHAERKNEKSSYTTVALVKMALKIILNYTTLPLKIMTYTGLGIGAVSFFIGLYFIIHKLLYGSVLGFTALIVSILFSTGMLLFSLGIIGEYINKIYFAQLAKPPFVIKKIIE